MTATLTLVREEGIRQATRATGETNNPRATEAKDSTNSQPWLSFTPSNFDSCEIADALHREIERKARQIDEYRDELVPAAMRYYLAIWNAAPDLPGTFQEFLEKFEAGEHLKQLLFDAPLSTPSSVEAVVQYYRSAFRFHRVPVPDVPGQGGISSLPALLSGLGLMDEIGYTTIPGAVCFLSISCRSMIWTAPPRCCKRRSRRSCFPIAKYNCACRR